jgi:hypothetical protein
MTSEQQFGACLHCWIWKKEGIASMITQQRSFQLITSPVGESCSPARLVISGRGIPHQTLTLFYEELQKTGSSASSQAILIPLLSFFSFMEQPAFSTCCTTQESKQIAGQANWAGSPSEIRAAIRAYLLTRWSCLTRAHGRQEEILLSPTGSETAEMQRFLDALQQFYRFAIKRGYYWYEGNPAAAFSLPMRSRLRQALSGAFRSLATHHPGNKDEGWNELPRQGNTPTALHEELPFPAEAWMQFVPVAEPVAMTR